jgi:hypothetical protein
MVAWVRQVVGIGFAVAVAGCAGPDDLTVTPGSDEEDGKWDRPQAPRVELKLALADPAAARADLGLTASNGQRRQIWFFDTPGLALFDAGIVLRARRVVGDDDDSTVKLRPLPADGVHQRWFEKGGFKCEADRSGEREVASCSLTRDQGPGEVQMVGDGRRRIATVFDADQQAFLAEHAALVEPGFELDELSRLGPIEVLVWKVESRALDGKLTVESWRLADGRELLEVSRKSDVGDADDALAELEAWLADRDLAVDPAGDGKTRAALAALAAAATAP